MAGPGAFGWAFFADPRSPTFPTPRRALFTAGLVVSTITEERQGTCVVASRTPSLVYDRALMPVVCLPFSVCDHAYPDILLSRGYR